jgi:hypothetical protein
LRVAVLDGDELDRGAGGAGDLGALARDQLDSVQLGGRRDGGQREGVARLEVVGVGLQRAVDGVADLQAEGREDIALGAVGVGEQREQGRAVGIVFDRLHLGGQVELAALEVDDAIELLVATAATAEVMRP